MILQEQSALCQKLEDTEIHKTAFDDFVYVNDGLIPGLEFDEKETFMIHLKNLNNDDILDRYDHDYKVLKKINKLVAVIAET